MQSTEASEKGDGVHPKIREGGDELDKRGIGLL